MQIVQKQTFNHGCFFLFFFQPCSKAPDWSAWRCAGLHKAISVCLCMCVCDCAEGNALQLRPSPHPLTTRCAVNTITRAHLHTHMHQPLFVRSCFPLRFQLFFVAFDLFKQFSLLKLKFLQHFCFSFFDKVYILYIFCYLRYFGTHTCLMSWSLSLSCMLICVGGSGVSRRMSETKRLPATTVAAPLCTSQSLREGLSACLRASFSHWWWNDLSREVNTDFIGLSIRRIEMWNNHIEFQPNINTGGLTLQTAVKPLCCL